MFSGSIFSALQLYSFFIMESLSIAMNEWVVVSNTFHQKSNKHQHVFAIKKVSQQGMAFWHWCMMSRPMLKNNYWHTDNILVMVVNWNWNSLWCDTVCACSPVIPCFLFRIVWLLHLSRFLMIRKLFMFVRDPNSAWSISWH